MIFTFGLKITKICSDLTKSSLVVWIISRYTLGSADYIFGRLELRTTNLSIDKHISIITRFLVEYIFYILKPHVIQICLGFRGSGTGEGVWAEGIAIPSNNTLGLFNTQHCYLIRTFLVKQNTILPLLVLCHHPLPVQILSQTGLSFHEISNIPTGNFSDVHLWVEKS